MHGTNIPDQASRVIRQLLDDVCPALNAIERNQAFTDLLAFASAILASYKDVGKLLSADQYVTLVLQDLCYKPRKFNSTPLEYVAVSIKYRIFTDLRRTKRLSYRDPASLILGAEARDELHRSWSEDQALGRIDAKRSIRKMVELIRSNPRKYPKRFAEYVELLADDDGGQFLSIATDSGEWIWHTPEIAEELDVSETGVRKMRKEFEKLVAAHLRDPKKKSPQN